MSKRQAAAFGLTVLAILPGLLSRPGLAEEELFVWKEGPERSAAIRVDPSLSGQPISRRLFGKFTEHLHRNIYHGMWSQVVRNPGFEDWRFFFSNDRAMHRARERAARSGSPWP